MSRLTGADAYSLMEAYSAVYQPELREDYLFEEFLTEEFILESYQSVADYLVYNNFVPGYATAEVYMSEMDESVIDDILIECGLYYNESLLNFANKAISGVKKVGSNIASGIRSGAGAVDRGVGAVNRGITTAKQVATGTVKRVGNVVKKAVTPVAQAVKGTAIRAVDAGKSALKTGANISKSGAQVVKGTAIRAAGAANRQIQGGVKNVQGAVQGGIKNVNTATQAVGGAVRKAGGAIANEIEVSRRSGGGSAGPKIVGPKIVGTGPRNFGSSALAAKNKQQSLAASFDYFDAVKGYLIDEGYADTEESALVIMANMSEDWKYSIVEQQMSSVSANAPSKVKKPTVTVSMSAGGKTPPGQKILDRLGQMLSGK